MKKFRLLLVLLGIIVTVSGCGKKIETPEENPTNTDEVIETKTTVIKAGEIPAEIFEWNEVASYTGDVDGDGTDEVVTLVTSAEYDEDGEFLWNDGQNWALYVDDREEDYLFFKKYINIGSVYFEVLDYYMDEGTVPAINVVESTGAGFSVKNYGFSSDDKGYIETVIYDTKDVAAGGTNRRYSSFPEYMRKK